MQEANAGMWMSILLYMYIHTYIHTYLHTYIKTHTHERMHMHAHTHANNRTHITNSLFPRSGPLPGSCGMETDEGAPGQKGGAVAAAAGGYEGCQGTQRGE